MSRASRIVIAEGLGTMILILGGPGSAIFAGPQIGVLGVSLAFGLSLLCAVYLFGGITGCHINPAVTIAMWSIKRTKAKEVPVYIVGQLIGAALGAVIIWAILDTDKLPKKITGSTTDLFTGASNGFGIEHGFFAFVAVMITEVVLTALFVLVIIGATRKSMPAGFAAIPIGLMLTLVHLISIPIDNTSVNPARSFATAIFAEGWAFEQLWVFVVFPIIGGLLVAGIWRALSPQDV